MPRRSQTFGHPPRPTATILQQALRPSPVSDSTTTTLARIRRAAGAVELRMRLARSLAVLPYAAATGLCVAAGILAFHKVNPARLTEPLAWRLLAATAALSLLPLIVAAARKLAPRAGSVALDRSHGLSDRLTSALEFEKLPAAERSPLMEMAIEDACARAVALSPGKAHPLRPPAELLAIVPALGALVVVALLEVPTVRIVPIKKSIDALVVAPDDIELFREMAKELAREEQTPEVKAAVDRFNQLVEDLANRRLERTEAFRAALQQKYPDKQIRAAVQGETVDLV